LCLNSCGSSDGLACGTMDRALARALSVDFR
jgi:hypothetical protein